jgi:hypothetical protein
VFLGDSHSEAGALFAAVAAKHCKEFILAARCFFEHAAESSGIK